MSESDPTGYRESPDTTDGTVVESQAGNPETGAPADEDAATLPTDDEAPQDDSLSRAGRAGEAPGQRAGLRPPAGPATGSRGPCDSLLGAPEPARGARRSPFSG